MLTHLAPLLDHRTTAGSRFFADDADRIARLCHAMATRFARGARLLALARSPAGCSDVRHVVVEFVHPVIVGKRALPAIGVSPAAGPLGAQLALLARPDDVVIAFGMTGDADLAEIAACVAAARAQGCLTIAFAPMDAAWEFVPPTDDPFVHQELVETLYHVVWELVHVYFEHRGLLDGRDAHGRRASDRVSAGAASFLYPFLGDAEPDIDAVVADVARSVRLKAEETNALRTSTLAESGDVLLATARTLRAVLDAGGTVLACGNGGSATDAMDLVADLRTPPAPWPPRRALDLGDDPSILTALANDIGTDVIFSRQVIAYGGRGDALVVFSTSGGSRNVIDALAEARRRGLVTVAFVGYDGGRVAAEQLADHVIVTRSQHVPRVQEAQATAYHALRALIEQVEPLPPVERSPAPDRTDEHPASPLVERRR